MPYFAYSLSCLWNKLITLMHFSRYHVDSHPLWLVRKLQHKMKRKGYTLLNMHSAQIRLRLMAESSAKGQRNIRAERASTDDACGYLHIFRPLKARCTFGQSMITNIYLILMWDMSTKDHCVWKICTNQYATTIDIKVYLFIGMLID